MGFHICSQNTIRKALSPEYYVDPLTGDLGNIKQANLHHHLTHCIDSVRQGLMCGADIRRVARLQPRYAR